MTPRNIPYLDYAATTPVDPAVVEAMTACLGPSETFGNPASRSHIHGWQAEERVEDARRQVADLVGADPREIIWTSGATEADNLALKGAAAARREQGRHIVSARTEHKAVLDSLDWLAGQGFEVTLVGPLADGRIDPQEVIAAMRADTVLVSIMHANNETGVINDIATIGAHCREQGVLFHVDAAQSLGKLDIDLRELPVDLMAFSGHKLYGPKGIGALYVRRAPHVRIEPQIHGGGHERGMRSGTLATHQVVGMGEACRIAGENMAEENRRLRLLRNRLWQGIRELGDVQWNGRDVERLPGHLNVAFAGVEGETLMTALGAIAVSSGSACTSASLEPSHVLHAMGLPDDLAHASVRFSVGRFTTEEEIDRAIEVVTGAVTRLRAAGQGVGAGQGS